jgi:hypothetical protein
LIRAAGEGKLTTTSWESQNGMLAKVRLVLFSRVSVCALLEITCSNRATCAQFCRSFSSISCRAMHSGARRRLSSTTPPRGRFAPIHAELRRGGLDDCSREKGQGFGHRDLELTRPTALSHSPRSAMARILTSETESGWLFAFRLGRANNVSAALTPYPRNVDRG